MDDDKVRSYIALARSVASRMVSAVIVQQMVTRGLICDWDQSVILAALTAERSGLGAHEAHNAIQRDLQQTIVSMGYYRPRNAPSYILGFDYADLEEEEGGAIDAPLEK